VIAPVGVVIGAVLIAAGASLIWARKRLTEFANSRLSEVEAKEPGDSDVSRLRPPLSASRWKIVFLGILFGLLGIIVELLALGVFRGA
jgi:hypothetical protein